MRTVEEKRLKPEQFRWLNPPNLVSATRVILAPVVGWAILSGRSTLALGIFAFAAATDALDGFLARKSKDTTVTGQYLDPIADKLLLSVVYVALGFAGRVPWWFVAIVFGRDLALLSASLIAMKVSRYDDYTPTIWGKISTFFQIAAGVSAMASSTSRVTRIAVYGAAAATLWSAIHYTYRGVSFFWRRSRLPASL